MSAVAQTRFAHKLFEPAPMTVSEAKTHCVSIFDKLRLQREQGRFCDVILKVYDREFPAHRCVLASCSPWFDTKFKVHKTLKEVVDVDCKNYEVFHLVLTYMYSGQLVIDKDNVGDILEISHTYSINKLKTYCAEFLEKNLKASNCLNVIELAERYHLADLSKQTLAYIHKHFEHIIQYHEIEKKSLADVKDYIDKAWYFPSELVLRLITRWVNQHSSREDHFVSLLHNVIWSTLDQFFISRHLEHDMLYQSSPEALLTILDFLDKNNIKLSSRYSEMYRELQEKLLPNNEVEQELDDSNLFLSMAINSAVMKDLEHSEVDETFSSYILQTEPIGDPSQYGPFRHPSGNEMENYKNETENSQEMIQFHSSFKKSANSLQGEESGNDLTKPGQQLETRVPENPASILPTIRMHHETVYELEHDSRVYKPEFRSIPIQCEDIPTSQYPTQSPPTQPETNLSFRSSNLDPCEEVYKSYNSQPPDISEQYYKHQNNFLSKSGQNYSNSDLRCMQYNPEQVVNDGTFNQDLFKNDLIYRGETRNPNYIYPIFRDNQMYPGDIDHYRSMCSNQQFENFKLEEENVMERTDYSSYKNDAESELRNSPVESSESDGCRPEKIERLNSKSDFDFCTYQFLEQVINEQEGVEKISTTTKRYDPKFRALAEAFKQAEPDLTNQVSSQDMFEYKSPERTTRDDKTLREEFRNCRISEKAKTKTIMDCQFESQVEEKDLQYVPVSAAELEYPRPDTQVEEVCEPIEETSADTNLGYQTPKSSFQELNEENSEIIPDSVLETPPKNMVEFSTPPKSTSKFSQQMILTPKEKYAKEINAERKLESIQKNVFPETEPWTDEPKLQVIDTAPYNTDIILQSTPEIPESPAVTENVVVPRKAPLTSTILRAKKKMASQKKLILEHGEVRLTLKQKIKLKPFRKKNSKILEKSLGHLSTSPDSLKKDCIQNTVIKRIVNRKDKLLAEHRSQQFPVQPALREEPVEIRSSPVESEDMINLDDIVNQIEETCPFCDFVCVSRKDFYKHIKEIHLTVAPYRCPLCEYTSSKLSTLLQHYQSHNTRYPCSSCTLSFLSNLELKRHEKSVHKPVITFSCPICEKVFNNKCTLQQHQGVHTEEKKFKCKLCTFSTKYNSHLAAHKRVHDGNLFRCTKEGCQYWTPKMTLLNAHIRAHNGDKRFTCANCDKGFVEAGQLRRHEKTHNDVKPFQCDFENCSFSSKRKDKLKDHKNRIHKPAPQIQPEISRPSKMMNMNKYYSVENSIPLQDSQIPYVKEEEILGV